MKLSPLQTDILLIALKYQNYSSDGDVYPGDVLFHHWQIPLGPNWCIREYCEPGTLRHIDAG